MRILLLLFIVAEKRVKYPLLPLAIFKNRELLSAIILYSCSTSIAVLFMLGPWRFQLLTLLPFLLLALPTLIFIPILVSYFVSSPFKGVERVR